MGGGGGGAGDEKFIIINLKWLLELMDEEEILHSLRIASIENLL